MLFFLQNVVAVSATLLTVPVAVRSHVCVSSCPRFASKISCTSRVFEPERNHREFHDETYSTGPLASPLGGRVLLAVGLDSPSAATALDFCKARAPRTPSRRLPGRAWERLSSLHRPSKAVRPQDAAGAQPPEPWQPHQEKARAASSRTRPSRCPTPTPRVPTIV